MWKAPGNSPGGRDSQPSREGSRRVSTGQAGLRDQTTERNVIFEIVHGDDKIAVEITSHSGRRKISLGNREILCDWLRLGDSHYSLILDGIVHDIYVNLSAEACDVSSRAGTYSFRIRDPRRAGTGEHSEGSPPGIQRICADMPGKVVRVLVQGGDEVVYDQSLLVLEAMKMQNDIRAPKSGSVKEIAVHPGSTVNTGDLLLVIE